MFAIKRIGDVMFADDDKRKLYWLFEMYFKGSLTCDQFDNLFHNSFGLSIDKDCLSELELRCFRELHHVINRYSPFEQDHKNLPGFFYSEEDLKAKIIETHKALKYESPLYQILLEVMEKLPSEDVKSISNSIDTFDWFSAIENLCIQLYLNKVSISKELYEKISDFGDHVGVDPFICLLLKELVI